MKRYLSLVLTLAMLLGCLPGGLGVVLSEEVIETPVEAEAPSAEEQEPLELTLDGVAPADGASEEDRAPSADGVLPPEPEAEAGAYYVRALREVVLEDGSVLEAGEYALATGETDGGLIRVAVHGPQGIVYGTAEPDALEALTGEALEACLNALAQIDGVALYQDDIDRPLPEHAKAARGAQVPAKITLNHDSLAIGYKEVYTGITALVTDAEGNAIPDAAVTWSVTSGSKYVTVDAGGKITGVKRGNAVVTASAGAGIEARVAIEVLKAPSKVTVTAATADLIVDESVDLKVAFDSGTASGGVTFTSSNPAVATVDAASGRVQAVGKGRATIRATAFNKKYGEIAVTVYGKPALLAPDQAEWLLVEGMTETIAVRALDADGDATLARPAFAIDPDSQNPDCIALDPDTGAVRALRKGQAAVRITAGAVGTVCTVKVVSAPADMRLSVDALEIGVGEVCSGVKVALIPPEGETDCQAVVTWRSSNAKYVKVDATTGAITGVKAGTAVVYATTHNHIERALQVTVKKAPKSISLKETSLVLGPKATAQLEPVTPGDSACATYKYSIDKPSVADVSPTGLVTGVARGTAVVTVQSYNGKKAYCNVTVLNAPASLKFERDTVQLAAGMTQALKVSALDADGQPAMGNYMWSIEEQDSVIVDDRGNVTALAAGSAVVTASVGDLRATCTVNVVAAPADIAIAAPALREGALTIGQKEVYTGLAVTLIPPEGAEKCSADVTWRSANAKIATVNEETGAVVGVKAGTTTLIAATHNGIARTIVVNVKKAPSQLKLMPATLGLSEGMSAPLTAAVNSNAASGAIRYVSSNPAVASVDANGVVTGHASGSAVITASTFNDKSAKCQVTVYGTPVAVGLTQAEYTLLQEETESISAKAVDRDGKYTPAVFTYAVDESSADPDCVTVDASGEIKGVRRGSAVIRVTANGGPFALCAVTVVSAAADMRFEKSEITIGLKEVYRNLKPILTPPAGEDACDAIITWRSEKGKYVKVDARTGEITGLKVGSAVIHARTHNGIERTVTVNVVKAPASATVTPDSARLTEGMTVQLIAAVNSGSASGAFTYTTSDPAVATVSGDGLVTAAGPGAAVITAESYNGKKASCAVTVLATPVRIELDKDAFELVTGETATIRATALAASGAPTLADLTYEVVENPECVSVNGEGVITAQKKGAARIEVRTQNGLVAEVRVQVENAPARVEISAESIALGVGETYAGLTAAAIPPEGMSDCAEALTWSNADDNVATLEGGTVTAVGEGTTVITATARGGACASVTVTVSAAPAELSFVPPTLALSPGTACKVSVAANAGAYARTINYAIEDPAVATVDADGTVHAVATGQTAITATAYNGAKGTGTIVVTGDPVQVFITEQLKLSVGASERLETYAVDADGVRSMANVSFTVLSGADVVEVDADGNVTAIGVGRAEIAVETSNGVSTHIDASTGEPVATVCSVTVTEAVARIGMPESLELKVGERVTISPVLYDADNRLLRNAKYTLTVSGSALSLSEDGVATGLSAGSAVITATAVNGVKATCTVLVYKPRYRFFAAYSFYDSKGKIKGGLYFPKNNAESVWKVLSKSSIDGVGYTKLGILSNPSKSGLLSGMKSAFADSKSTDVSVVYLCSHGFNYVDVDYESYKKKHGRLPATHYGLQLPGYTNYASNSKYYITAEEIFSAVSAIRGKVVLILDSCYSGEFITNMRDALDVEGGRITVMTAAGNTLASYYNVKDTDRACDFFTYFLLLGAKYDMKEHEYVTGSGADANRDGKLTVREMFNFASSNLAANLRSYMTYSWYHGEKDVVQKPVFYAGANADLVIYQ